MSPTRVAIIATVVSMPTLRKSLTTALLLASATFGAGLSTCSSPIPTAATGFTVEDHGVYKKVTTNGCSDKPYVLCMSSAASNAYTRSLCACVEHIQHCLNTDSLVCER